MNGYDCKFLVDCFPIEVASCCILYLPSATHLRIVLYKIDQRTSLPMTEISRKRFAPQSGVFIILTPQNK